MDFPEWHEGKCPHRLFPSWLTCTDAEQAPLEHLEVIMDNMKETVRIPHQDGTSLETMGDELSHQFDFLCTCETKRPTSDVWKEHRQRWLNDQISCLKSSIEAKKNEPGTLYADATVGFGCRLA